MVQVHGLDALGLSPKGPTLAPCGRPALEPNNVTMLLRQVGFPHLVLLHMLHDSLVNVVDDLLCMTSSLAYVTFGPNLSVYLVGVSISMPSSRIEPRHA